MGEKFDQLREKAEETMDRYGDKLELGADKAREVADDKTSGKYSDQLEQGADQVKDRFGNQDR